MKTRNYYMIYNTSEYSVAVFGKDKTKFYDKKEAERALEFANKKNPIGKYIMEEKTESYDDTKIISKKRDEDWEHLDKPLPKTNNQYNDK